MIIYDQGMRYKQSRLWDKVNSDEVGTKDPKDNIREARLDAGNLNVLDGEGRTDVAPEFIQK
jgi:hypothetical protein